MRLIKIASFLFIFIIWAKLSFADPGVKITQPENNSIVNPGQQITVTVEAVDGFEIKKGIFGYSNFFGEKFTTLPATFAVTIPQDAAGTFTIVVVAEDILRKNAGKDEIILKVEQTSTLKSLDFGDYSRFHFTADWNGKPNPEDNDYIRVRGIYSDGVRRKIPKEELVFVSSDPSVVFVDNAGVIKPLKLGKAAITVSIAGVSAIVLVFVEEPYGIRPSETIPPTIQIDIQPPVNTAGWHSQDITITLIAQDNEGGSGISEISYQFPKLSAKSTWVEDNQAIIPFSKEGIYLLRYGTRDKERNSSGQQTTEIRLDKTSPIININANPSILWPPNHKMVYIKISGSAADNLSGVDSVSFKVTDEYGKIEPLISKFGDTIQLEAWREGKDLDGRTYTISVTAKDKAGNESRSSTTVICPHDQRE